MKEPSIIFKSAAKGADQLGALPPNPGLGEQQTNLNAIVFSKNHPILPSFSDFFLLNLTHTTCRLAPVIWASSPKSRPVAGPDILGHPPQLPPPNHGVARRVSGWQRLQRVTFHNRLWDLPGHPA